jgi:uncharacterized protein YdiU (UPF0061 family)
LKPLRIPTNVCVKIFSKLHRDDIDNCMLVCRLWKWLIEYGKKDLPKRKIDALLLSTNKEFTIKAYFEDRVKIFAFKKYFRDM